MDSKLSLHSNIRQLYNTPVDGLKETAAAEPTTEKYLVDCRVQTQDERISSSGSLTEISLILMSFFWEKLRRFTHSEESSW